MSEFPLGEALARRLANAVHKLQLLPAPGARSLPRLEGITTSCTTPKDLENILSQATGFLQESRRVYRYGNSVVFEQGKGSDQQLVPLALGHDVDPGAASQLANLFLCRSPSTEKSPSVEFAPPSGLARILLCREPTLEILPRVKLYVRRPVFDNEYRLCGPGWHEQSQILVHGINIDPVLPEAKPNLERPCIERLPPHMQTLLRDFCFKSDADVANAIGGLLTGLLINHHLDTGHPMLLLDGNQPGVGKTLLARAIGMVLDGVDPHLIDFTSDEELPKRIVATLRGSKQSTLIFDNAKLKGGLPISSTVLEANSVAAEVSLRILGESTNYTRPNDLLWFVTMNDTKTSPDLVSRGLPIRFYHEGDPRHRAFHGRDPLEYARRHRAEILGELAGMVLFWNQQGRPLGTCNHRLTKWASQIGGILVANGLPEALQNFDEAAAEFDAERDELTALAEAALRTKSRHFYRDAGEELNGETGGSAADWENVFVGAGVAADKLEHAKSDQSKAKIIGNVLGRHVDKSVSVEAAGRIGRGRLVRCSGRSKKQLYRFEFTWDDEQPQGTTPVDGTETPVLPTNDAKTIDESRASERGNNEPW